MLISAHNWRSERSHSEVMKIEICDIIIICVYVQVTFSCVADVSNFLKLFCPGFISTKHPKNSWKQEIMNNYD